jgi:SAM-dependent methyltransferase
MNQPAIRSPINKSMDRDDLLDPDGAQFVGRLDALARELETRRLPVTSWYGGLARPAFELSISGLRRFARRLLGKTRRVGAVAAINRGGDEYESVPGITRDERHPWFLYWEAFWVTSRGPTLSPSSRVLDAGGTASLFSCHLASLGPETHSVDLNRSLVAAGEETAQAMGWNLHSYCMDMTDLDFEDDFFDHAYSICVFEHLDADLRARALREIGRVLKAGGILSLTFDFAGPGVSLAGSGLNYDPKNLIQSPDDVKRHFFSCDRFQPVGNSEFSDNGKRYLLWPDNPHQSYTFGAVFLRKIR